jgi:ABC-type dipeptide/oligopeptide/nickel transport system permease component
MAFLAAALPGEVRWLAQAMPGEHPFPLAWGDAAVKRVRRIVLLRIWRRWLAARLPLWLTATLVLERVLGLPGLGTDWLTRVSLRDHHGLAVWVLVLALLWGASQAWENEPA